MDERLCPQFVMWRQNSFLSYFGYMPLIEYLVTFEDTKQKINYDTAALLRLVSYHYTTRFLENGNSSGGQVLGQETGTESGLGS
jgi:hypothetical protein